MFKLQARGIYEIKFQDGGQKMADEMNFSQLSNLKKNI